MFFRWIESLVWLIDGGSTETSWQMIALRIALVCCSFLLVVQVLSLLATRWGDQNATGKSFFASLVLHIWLGLAWATVVQQESAYLGEANWDDLSTPGPPIQLVSSDEAASDIDAANASFSRLSPSESLAVERTERSLTETDRATPVPLPDPLEREKSPDATLPVELPKPQMAAAQPDVPQPRVPDDQSLFPAVPVATAPPPSEGIKQQTLENPLAAISRQTMTPQNTPLESDDLRPPAAGGADRADEKIQPLASKIELPQDPTASDPQPNAITADSMTRRTAPLATPVPANIPGADSSGPDPSVRPSVPARSQFSRQTPVRSSQPTEGAPVAALPTPPATSIAAAERPLMSEQLAAIRASAGLPRSEDLAPPTPTLPSRSMGTIMPKRPAAAMTPQTYQLRRLDKRREIALQNGGTEASEAAVELSLKWLATHQEADGSWSPGRWGGGAVKRSPEDPVDLVDRKGSGVNSDTGITGLALLSFLGAGYTREEGQYARNVKDALSWLMSQQRVDGYMGGKANYYDGMYCHGIASYALAEACAMQEDPQADPELRNVVARAAQFTIQMQNRDGGWRYQKGAIESDMSMFGWQLMVLKSSEIAGISIPPETRDGMITFLKARSRGVESGLAGYRRSSPPSPAMTAEAHFCKQMFGIKPSNEASIEATSYLQRAVPRISQPNDYYWYYGTLTMFQHGGEPWEAWNQGMRESLVQTQRQSGPYAGTWDPNDPWGGIGGRVYSTAMATLCLEVYYRFLPLYRVNETAGN
ncbi:MAG: hypothetical protein C0478_05640 [Planctomyces sp.]|nr:hypothetical protein [Planctomyces sp.]